MNHIEEELLTSYLLGDLDAATADAVRKHLETCESCRALSQELDSTLNLLRGAMAADSSAPEFLDAQHKKNIRKGAPSLALWMKKARVAVISASVVLVAAIALFFMTMSAPVFKMHEVVSFGTDLDQVAPRQNKQLASEGHADYSRGRPDSVVDRVAEVQPAAKPVLEERLSVSELGDKKIFADAGQSNPVDLNAPVAQAPAGPEDAEVFSREADFVELDSMLAMNGSAGSGGGTVISSGRIGGRAEGGEKESVDYDGWQQTKSSTEATYAERRKLRQELAKNEEGKVGALDDASSVEMFAPLRSAVPASPAEEPIGGVYGAEELAAVNGKDESDVRDEREKAPAKESEPKVAAVFNAMELLGYVKADAKPLSTFSLDVDTASYTIARKYMQSGMLPPPAAIRAEEFINFFDYGYAPPESRGFSIESRYAPSPFHQGRLLQIGVKARQLGRDVKKPVVLTLVIDTSGSMETPDRLGLVRKSVRLLLDRMNPSDRVAVVQYDSSARLALEHTPVSEKDKIIAVVDGLQTSGSTHLDEGLVLGYEIAAGALDSAAMNRVVLMSDGVANLGAENPDEILKSVEEQRRRGIFLSVFGFGLGTYNDPMLETLADAGDGSYQFIDSLNEAQRLFVEAFAATLHTMAKDVKIQVEFNPSRVKQYRQVGYENRQLAAEDFRNDAVDAGEAGSGQSVTALYDVDVQGDDREPLATVRIRYFDMETGAREEIERSITAADAAPAFDQASPRFRLAACVAAFAEKLRGAPWSANYEFADIAAALRPVALELGDARVQELLQLVNAADSLPQAQ